MRKAIIYAALAATAVLWTGCSKNGAIDDVDADTTRKEAKIGFGTASAKSTDALTPDDENYPLQISVYDYYTGEDPETIWIEDIIQRSVEDPKAWAYAKDGTTGIYSWKNGSHKFFGWVSRDEDGKDLGVSKDEDGNPLVNLKYNPETKVLSLSNTTLAGGASNPDYRYSEVNTVLWPNADMIETVDGKRIAKSVELEIKHLTSALTYTVEDYMYGGKISNVSVTVNGVIINGTASVDFSGETVSPVTTPGTTTGNVSLVADTDFAPVPAAPALYFKGDTTSVWPQSVSGAKVVVKYTPNGGTEQTVQAVLPDVTWEAGYCYNLKLQIVNKSLELTFTVAPWEGVEKNIDTSNGSINMSNVTWMNTKVKLTENGDEVNTVDNSGYSVSMYKDPYVNKNDTWTKYDGYFPAQGFFTVNYPVSGLFKIELIPAYGETEVEPEMYEIYIYDYPPETTEGSFRAINADGEPISNETVYFQVRAAAGQDGAQHKAQINILFKAADTEGSTENSEWISAYSEIRANYALTIPAI